MMILQGPQGPKGQKGTTKGLWKVYMLVSL